MSVLRRLTGLRHWHGQHAPWTRCLGMQGAQLPSSRPGAKAAWLHAGIDAQVAAAGADWALGR